MKRLHHAALLTAALVLFSLAQASSAAAGWLNGSFAYHNNAYCFDLYGTYGPYTLTDESTGYWMNDATSPKVGDVYYTNVFVANVSPGVPCVATLMQLELSLPPNTVPAVDAANPIQCFYTDTTGVRSGMPQGNYTNYSCPGSASMGSYGYALGWATLVSGAKWEVWMPVISAQTLNGIGAANDKLVAHVNMLSGNSSGWSNPYAYVTVFANPPTIDYPAPSATTITNTTAHTVANLNAHYQGGTLYFDLGTATSYGQNQPLAIGTTYNILQGYADWTGLLPATTYHWRGRFVTTGGLSYYGADQTFTTTGTPAPTTYTLTISPATGGTVAANPSGAGFAAGTSVALTATPAAGYTFSGWTLDGANGGASNPYTITMNGNHTVQANFAAIPGATMYTLTITPSTGGSVAASPSGTSFAAGTSVALTATPSAGYSFSSWTVDSASAGSANPYTITMNGNHTVQAGFAVVSGPTPTIADLSLTMTASPSSTVVAGSTVTFLITVANNGPAQATNVVVTDVLPPGLTFVSGSSGMSACQAADATVTCPVGTMANGSSASATVVARVTTQGSFNNQADVTSSSTDDLAGNNSATVTVAAAASSDLAVAAGSHSPSQTGFAVKGTANSPMLQITFNAAAVGESLQVEKITLQAGGTGNDASDISSVKLYLDVNGNGLKDAGDTLLSSGTFTANNGTLDLAAALTVAAGTSQTVLITYDFNNTLAAVPFSAFPMAALPFAFVGMIAVTRSRYRLMAALLTLTLFSASSCGGGGGGGSAPNAGGTGLSRTYQVTVSGVTAKRAVSGAASAVSGLPIAGATVTVNK